MKSKLFLCVAVAVLGCPLFAEPQKNDGTISNVIVYHGQALVTRTIELKRSGEDIELLVENLPDKILPESLYALSNDGIQVLSVRYREKTITEDNRKEVKELEDQIYDIDRQMRNNTRNMDNTKDRIDRYRDQWKFVADTSKTEMNHGVLNAKTIIDLNEFLAAKNKAIHEELVTLENQNLDLEKQKAQLAEKLEKLKNARRNTTREALIYLHVPATAASNVVQLSYLVGGADWSPQYNLKARPDEKTVNVEYNAVVHQASGEDWNNTRLALSTAVPALVATPPSLEPLKITLIDARNRSNIRARRSIQPVSEAADQEQQQMAVAQQQDSYSYVDQGDLYSQMTQSRYDNISKGIKANEELNFFASNTQMVEFEADRQLLQQIKQKAVAIKRAEGVSVMYALPGRLTLPSKSDQQLVTIASIECPATFTFVAAPLLTDYVYLEGELTNTSDTILLPGVSDTFRNGEFVGKGDMKLVTIGQTFTAGFGVDSQIQVAREFKDKNIRTLLGNRIDENHYRIAIDNYYDKPVPLRLMDRLPWTENKDLDIELNENSHPLSTDDEYVRTQKDKGILRWDLKLDPNTHGKNATIVNYTFMMKYDNDMAIQNIR